jgi:poly-beta-1,6-N-acetyl-D-glucosamine synthase
MQDFLSLNHTEIILLSFFVLMLVLQLFHYLYFYSRLVFYKPQTLAGQLPPVSVVIAAHNEAYNLEKNLPAVLEQDYPDFEVIVVNDGSHDETEEVLAELCQQYPLLKVVNVKQSVMFYRSKKLPLSVGIKSASHEILLLTDADCRPVSPNWIRTMTQAYTSGNEIVLGFGPYQKYPGLLNLLIRYDTFLTAMQYFSAALAGWPYMGVGRNLSYKKELFFRHKGFISHYHIPSGDDDLFINMAATSGNTRIQTEPESHVYSEPEKSFRNWLRQKRRHFSTGKLYKPGIKMLLGLHATSGILYYTVFWTLIGFQIMWQWVLGLHALRLLLRLLMFGYGAKKLNQKKLYLLSPLLDGFFIFFNSVLAVSGLTSKSKKWK